MAWFALLGALLTTSEFFVESPTNKNAFA